MSNDLEFDEDPEKPLDPAVIRVQQRLRRLLLGSSLIMVLGFIAVFGAIYYRISQSTDEAVPAVSESVSIPEIAQLITLPGALGTLIDVSLSRGQLVATFEEGTGSFDVLIINRADGTIVERYRLEEPR